MSCRECRGTGWCRIAERERSDGRGYISTQIPCPACRSGNPPPDAAPQRKPATAEC